MFRFSLSVSSSICCSNLSFSFFFLPKKEVFDLLSFLSSWEASSSPSSTGISSVSASPFSTTSGSFSTVSSVTGVSVVSSS